MFSHLRTLLILALLLGCTGSSKTASVTGRITYNGKPVPKANVSFTPLEGSARAATGLTDDSGKFTLGTYSTTDGAPPGNYRISIIARGPDRAPKAGEGSGMPGEKVSGDPIIPQRYFAPDSSGLTFEVKKGGNTADFDLKE